MTVKTVSPSFYVFNLIQIFGDLTHSCFFLALFLRGKGLIKTMPGSGLTPGVNQRVKAWYLWLECETIGNLQHLAASSQKWTLSDTLRNQLRSCRVWIALKNLCVFCGHAESARFSKCYIWSCYIWTWKKQHSDVVIVGFEQSPSRTGWLCFQIAPPCGVAVFFIYNCGFCFCCRSSAPLCSLWCNAPPALLCSSSSHLSDTGLQFGGFHCKQGSNLSTCLIYELFYDKCDHWTVIFLF